MALADIVSVFRGRLRSKHGTGVSGARVEVIDSARDAVCAAGFSDDAGSFCVRVTHARSAARKATPLALRAVGQEDYVLVDPVRLPRARQTTIETDLTVTEDRLKKFRPFAQIPRRTGSVVDPSVLPMLDAAVHLVVPRGEPGHNRLLRVARYSVPMIARFQSMLDDAWSVLDGDEAAAQRLRRALSFIANVAPVAPPDSANANDRLSGRFPLLPVSPPSDEALIPDPGVRRASCGLPIDRLLPVLAATLRIATDPEDTAGLLGALDAGLRGIRRFDTLTGLARDALSSGVPGPLTDEFSRLAVEMAIDDDRALGGGLDWPYPPPDRMPPPLFELCHDLRTRCFQGLADNWRLHSALQPAVLTLPYRITSVKSDTACPGETVVIEGTNFGSTPGQVLFPDRDGVSSIAVDPVAGTWKTDRVEAIVPTEAGSGLIRLSILEGSLWTCAGAVSVYRQGIGVAFHGGAPYVSSVTINGASAGAVVAPDSEYTVAWTASPDPTMPPPVLVTVYEELPSMFVLGQPMPATGTVTLRASPRTTPGKIRAAVFAFGNRCGNPHRLVAEADILQRNTLDVAGFEVTQGIQVFSLQGARNTLATIAGKDTIVRVYVSANVDVPGVTGVLEIDGVRLSPINGITPDRPSGGNPFVTARPVTGIDRTKTDHTLNFRIPASLCAGTKYLYALIWATSPGNTTLMTMKAMSWTWEPRRPLKVRFVRLQDDRPPPDGTGMMPTDAEARQSLARAFDLLPTPATDIAPAWYPTHSVTIGNHVVVWTQLRLKHRDPDPATGVPDPARWIGLSDEFIFSGALGFSALNVAGATTYKDRDRQGPFRVVPAHELAHTLGACHVDDATCSMFAANQLLQEVLFDPYWNEAFFPVTDVMMTAGIQGGRYWTSPSLWDFLRSRIT